MFITPSFKKSLIVEQFQGNYLKYTVFATSNFVSYKYTSCTFLLQERMKVMTTLVVKYLTDRYSARWKEPTAGATEHRKTSQNP